MHRTVGNRVQNTARAYSGWAGCRQSHLVQKDKYSGKLACLANQITSSDSVCSGGNPHRIFSGLGFFFSPPPS